MEKKSDLVERDSCGKKTNKDMVLEFALIWYRSRGPHRNSALPLMSSQLLRLNAFRGEPASSGLEWHFTPNHNSSADSSTPDLHLVSPKLHPGHG
ncbi:unnamed protein product [Lupinus luteus]|uniref:Uncharacterized protein n=1 Tax=Lupinus luteus TaxID=3873 RepID=A0AAV1XE57_LUPLU